MDRNHRMPRTKPNRCFATTKAGSFRLHPRDTLSDACASSTASAPQMLNSVHHLSTGAADILSPVLSSSRGTTMALPKLMDLDVNYISRPSKRARAASEENDFIEIEWIASGFYSLDRSPQKTTALGLINYSVHLCCGVTDSYPSKVEVYEAVLSENYLSTGGAAILSPVLSSSQGTTMALPKLMDLDVDYISRPSKRARAASENNDFLAILSPVLSSSQGTTMALPKGISWNRGQVFDLDVDISRPSKRARANSEDNDFIEIQWIASGFYSPQKTTALDLIKPNGYRVEEGGVKRKWKDIIGKQFQWQGACITQSSLRPEVVSQALLQPQSACRTMGPGIDVTQPISEAKKVQRFPEFEQNQSVVKPAMRVCSPNADVQSLTSTSPHAYISKKDMRPPTAEVTMSSDVHSHPSGINLNNAETRVNAALEPHPCVAIVTTQQCKTIKTELPEHKVTSSVHPTKKEPVDNIQRPPAESEDYLHRKLVYNDMVRRHMNEHVDDEQTSFTLKTELLKLMTHVAGQTQSNSKQWQHPSDLTSRNCQVRPRNLKPLLSLSEWQNHNNGHQRRFDKLPNDFERSPII